MIFRSVKVVYLYKYSVVFSVFRGADDVYLSEKKQTSRLLSSHLAESFYLRGGLKTVRRTVFLTPCSIPITRITKNRHRLGVCFYRGADDGNRTHTISLEG